jgi:hypothetical protein
LTLKGNEKLIVTEEVEAPDFWGNMMFDNPTIPIPIIVNEHPSI